MDAPHRGVLHSHGPQARSDRHDRYRSTSPENRIPLRALPDQGDRRGRRRLHRAGGRGDRTPRAGLRRRQPGGARQPQRSLPLRAGADHRHRRRAAAGDPSRPQGHRPRAHGALVTELVVRNLGLAEYLPTLEAMRSFTAERDQSTPDEIWLLQHPRVFTQGQAGKPEHLLAPGDIPVVQVERGGQVTYHGPGQLVAYLMLDLRRKKLGVRELVTAMEQALVDVLASYAIAAAPKADAPGVY